MPPSWDVSLPPPMIFQVAKGVYPVGEPEPRWRDRGEMQAMSPMLFLALALIWTLVPATAAVLTFSCDGTMKEEAQRKAHAITKMGLIVNSDAGVVTGFTGITARWHYQTLSRFHNGSLLTCRQISTSGFRH
jgi:hypothetical protein